MDTARETKRLLLEGDRLRDAAKAQGVRLPTRRELAEAEKETINLYDVGRRVASGRALENWTQRDLATRAGVTQATIARLERGTLKDVRSTTLYAIAVALSMSLDYLTGRTETPRLQR